MLPAYLRPIDKIRVRDPQSQENIMSWVFDRLEKENIPYISKKLDIADYIVRNKNTDNITVIKRMGVQTIAEMWSNKFKGRYYQGKKGFTDMMRDLRNNFASNVRIVLAVEDYYSTMFDNTNNCIWTSWRFNESTKTDSRGNSIYNNVNFKRYQIHPRIFDETLESLTTNYNIVIKRFYNGESLYSYIVYDLIYNDDADVDIDQPLYVHNPKVDVLVGSVPYLTRDAAVILLNEFGTVYNALKSVIEDESIGARLIQPESREEFDDWRKTMLEE